VFPIFFLLFYGLVHYAMLFAVSTGLTAAASDAARAAIQVSPEEEDYEARVIAQARAAAVERLSWLGESQRSIVLGNNGENVSVAVYSDATLGPAVRVDVSYPSYPSQPILPIVSLPFLGPIPPLPAQLSARAIVQL